MALLMVTGYEYKGVGSKMKGSKKETDKTDKKKPQKASEILPQDSGEGFSKSQVDVRSSTQGKAKSRSGI